VDIRPSTGPAERTRADTWSRARTRSVTRRAGPSMAPAGRPFVFVVLLFLHREAAQRQVYAVASKGRARATTAGGVRTHASPTKGKSLKKAWQKKLKRTNGGEEHRINNVVSFCLWPQRRDFVRYGVRGGDGQKTRLEATKVQTPNTMTASKQLPEHRKLVCRFFFLFCSLPSSFHDTNNVNVSQRWRQDVHLSILITSKLQKAFFNCCLLLSAAAEELVIRRG
jgi:hypothetical protein